MAYGKITGSSIGSLLRMIAEQKSESPIISPRAQTGAPMRKIVQEPLRAPESPGAGRVVSLKPEGVVAPETSEENITPMRSAVGPISIGGAPVTPPPATTQEAPRMMGPTGPSTPPSMPTPVAPSPAKQVTRYAAGPTGQQSLPSIGTVLGASTKEYLGPSRGDIAMAKALEEIQNMKADVAALKFAANPNSTQAQEEFRRASSHLAPTPTPTPAPRQPTIPQASIPRTTTAPPVNVQRAVQSGGLTYNKPAPPQPKPQSVPQKIATTISSLIKKFGWW